MSETDGRTDWSKVNVAIQRHAQDQVMPLSASPTLPAPGAPDDGSKALAKPDGVIQSYKMKKVAKKAAVEHLEAWYATGLEVARHHMAEVARVKKAESTMVADQFLRNLNAQHLEYLTTLGLQNEGVRSRAVIALNDQTSATLKEIQTRDWPEPLITSAINGILDRQRRFMERLVNELGD